MYVVVLMGPDGEPAQVFGIFINEKDANSFINNSEYCIDDLVIKTITYVEEAFKLKLG